MTASRIGKNIFANYFGMLIHIVIGFLLSPYLVNTLGDSQYGVWSIAAALTGYMSLFDLGLNSAVNRYVAWHQGKKDTEKVNEVLSTGFLLFSITSTLVISISPFVASIIVGFISLEAINEDILFTLALVVCFDVSIFVFGGLFRGAMGGIQRYDLINGIQIISAIYKALAFVAVLEFGLGLISLAAVSASANLISTVIFYVLLKKLRKDTRISCANASKEMSLNLIHFGKFTFIAMLANQLVYYSDAFVIGYFLSAAAVTYYSIAWTLTEYSKKLCLAFSRTFTPAISDMDSRGETDNIHSIFLSGTRYLLIISNLLCIGVLVLGGDFIAVWMGQKYKALCEDILIILFINQLILCPQFISYSLLQGLEKQKHYTYYTMAVSLTSLALSILLVQSWGLIGVAIGTVIPQIIFHGLIVPAITLKTINLNLASYLKQTYLRVFLPSLALALSLKVTSYHWPIDGYITLLWNAILSSSVYLALSFLVALDKTERKVVLNYLGIR